MQMYKTNAKDLETFKNSTTVFILSEVYDTATNEKILKNAWTVTPYKIVKYKDFNFKDYLDGKHSFAYLQAYRSESKTGTIYYGSYITFCIYDIEDKLKEIEKLEKKSDKKKEDYNIFKEDRTAIANITLFPNTEMTRALSTNDLKEAEKILWEKEAFIDYKAGYLRNYFQAISKFIDTNSPGGMYREGCTPEVKNLKKSTLFMSYLTAVQSGTWKTDETKVAEEIAGLFKDYKYKHEILDDDALSAKIMSGEEFYYLRFIRDNSERFINVVNSKTGEIVYKNYHPGGYDFKPDHLKDLKKAVDTGKM